MACRRSQVRSLSGPPFDSLAKAGLFCGPQALATPKGQGRKTAPRTVQKFKPRESGAFLWTAGASNAQGPGSQDSSAHCPKI